MARTWATMLVDQIAVVDGDNDAGGIGQAADFEKFRIGGVAVIDVVTVAAVVRHGRGHSKSAAI